MKYLVATEDEFGLTVVQEDNFKTFEEAQKEADECIERWGENGQDFYALPYNAIGYEEPNKEPREYANPNAVDGWEDLFPTRE